MPVTLEEYACERRVSGNQGGQAKALLLGAQIDSQLEVHHVGREVNNSRRYEGSTDTKKPVVNSI
jgi:hypothetical protein